MRLSLWSLGVSLICGLQLFAPVSVMANDFSSFLSANASLGKINELRGELVVVQFSMLIILAAVVVDYEYMATHRQNIMAHFEKILSDTIRENMKNGGINVRYFTWNSIKIKKGSIKKIRAYICT